MIKQQDQQTDKTKCIRKVFLFYYVGHAIIRYFFASVSLISKIILRCPQKKIAASFHMNTF